MWWDLSVSLLLIGLSWASGYDIFLKKGDLFGIRLLVAC